jgi:hypothetical protein
VVSLHRAILEHAVSQRLNDRQSALERCAFELEWIVENLASRPA